MVPTFLIAAAVATGVGAPTALTDDACARVAVEAARGANHARAAQAVDWPGRCRYAAENATVKSRPRIVFMGDSITEFWKREHDAFFADDMLDRGISGQTSSQMVARFYADVVALRPRTVHILAGANDIAGNTGPITAKAYHDNIRAMAALARAHHIRVVIGSLLPADRFYWNAEMRPASVIRDQNAWLRDYARAQGFAFVDYYAAMATPAGALRPEFTKDGAHPNAAGYAAMEKVAAAVLGR